MRSVLSSHLLKLRPRNVRFNSSSSFLSRYSVVTGSLLVGGGAVGLMFSSCRIPEGHVGVMSLFGKVKPITIGPGLTFVNPLANVRHWSIQTRVMDFKLSVPSQEGVMLGVDLSLQYRLNPEDVIRLFSTVGANYEEVIIKPLVHSCVRSVSSGHDTKAFYTSSVREEMSSIIFAKLSTELALRGIIVESVPLRNIGLPPSLVKAIEEKMQADQASQQMAFVLTKARQEAERKEIEAKGIQAFQDIVSKGISPHYLQWKGIEATLALANSTNAKVVVIGSGSNGLPLILNSA
jgi:prohibitin 1